MESYYFYISKLLFAPCILFFVAEMSSHSMIAFLEFLKIATFRIISIRAFLYVSGPSGGEFYGTVQTKTSGEKQKTIIQRLLILINKFSIFLKEKKSSVFALVGARVLDVLPCSTPPPQPNSYGERSLIFMMGRGRRHGALPH